MAKRSGTSSKRSRASNLRSRAGARRARAAKPPPPPLVCFVTPTSSGNANKSQNEFTHELNTNLGWGATITPFAANDVPNQLQGQVQAAVDAAHAALATTKAVVVTGGTNATTMAQQYANSKGLTNTLAIIQGVGGAVPTNLLSNVTGFFIDAVATAQKHFEHLVASGATSITVLYDSSNPPSNFAYQTLYAFQQDYFSGVTINPINLQQLGNISGAFMVIPNATFYSNRVNIANAVDNAGVTLAIYPEREYKKAHNPNNRKGKVVHGHSVGLTYRLAASYVDSIFDGTFDATTLPPFKEAVIDKDLD
jgi:hypothetical protein